MNRFAATGLAGALCLAIGLAEAADPPSAKAPTAGKKLDDKATPATPKRPPVIIAPLTPEVLAEAVKDEQTACTRRLDACAKLREIAAAKNDESTLQRIDDLEKQILDICQARVARMGVRGNATRPNTAKANADRIAPLDGAPVAPPTPDETVGGKR